MVALSHREDYMNQGNVRSKILTFKPSFAFSKRADLYSVDPFLSRSGNFSGSCIGWHKKADDAAHKTAFDQLDWEILRTTARHHEQ